MVSLFALFVVFVGFFALIGAVRGWAKEMLVASSAVLALFLLHIFAEYTPMGRTMDEAPPNMRFWVQAAFVIVLAMFGYVGPTLSHVVRGKLKRETLQDILLGTVIGAINGYLIIGSVLYFLDQAGYPFEPFVMPPGEGDVFYGLVQALAPAWLKPPQIFFAVGLAFVAVIILFV